MKHIINLTSVNESSYSDWGYIYIWYMDFSVFVPCSLRLLTNTKVYKIRFKVFNMAISCEPLIN